jgi:hypothetical protein
MHLVQMLLPLYDNDGRRFPEAALRAVRARLVERFGGVTAFSRAPAEGVWREEDGDLARDEIVIVEVMVEDMDRDWWRSFRAELERIFRQDEIVIRAHPIERL